MLTGESQSINALRKKAMDAADAANFAAGFFRILPIQRLN
jgi:hypothetical protein